MPKALYLLLIAGCSVASDNAYAQDAATPVDDFAVHSWFGTVAPEADEPDQLPMDESEANLVGTEEMAGAIVEALAVPVPKAGTWAEDATRIYYDYTLNLHWERELGDYDPTPIGSVQITDKDLLQRLVIPVTGGNNFILKNGGGGKAYIASREYGTSKHRPILKVNGKSYLATRDALLHPSMKSPAPTMKEMIDDGSILIGFDGYKPVPGDRVELHISTTRQYGTHRLNVHTPTITYRLPEVPTVFDGTVIIDYPASSFRPASNMTVANGIATATIEGTKLTWFNQFVVLPPADEYVMTTLVKLHNDWPNMGGKLPGLSSTGQATNTAGVPLTINGVNCTNAGWGGRAPNGCRWSARTAWHGRRGQEVGLGTYLYALSPDGGSYGWGEDFPLPAPVDKWFALVQRVKINSVGESDGIMSYWLCTNDGCYAQYHREDIRYRDANLPQATVTEMWGDVYCGGLDCGTAPWPKSTASMKRMTATKGLPDMNALWNEVRALNGLAPAVVGAGTADR